MYPTQKMTQRLAELSTVDCRKENIFKRVGGIETWLEIKLLGGTNHKQEGQNKHREGRGVDLSSGTQTWGTCTGR